MNEVAGPAKVHDALTGTIDWTAPEFAQSIDLLKQYFDKGWFGGGVKPYFSTTDPQKYTKFASGQAGKDNSRPRGVLTPPHHFRKGHRHPLDLAPPPAPAHRAP